MKNLHFHMLFIDGVFSPKRIIVGMLNRSIEDRFVIDKIVFDLSGRWGADSATRRPLEQAHRRQRFAKWLKSRGRTARDGRWVLHKWVLHKEEADRAMAAQWCLGR